jgi:hypothetical protein
MFEFQSLELIEIHLNQVGPLVSVSTVRRPFQTVAAVVADGRWFRSAPRVPPLPIDHHAHCFVLPHVTVASILVARGL